MISPTLTSSSTASALPTAAPPSQADAVLSSDFETFIKMLTTQAKYQDPLEPIDSSEYASQLAQFSMVEQQVLSNDLLTALTSQLSGGTMGQLAGWIGMEARTTEPAQFDGSPISVLPTIPPGAEEMSLVVYDAQGVEVDRGALPISSAPVLWAGVQQDGQPFSAGQYQFKIEGTANGEILSLTDAATYARIVEVQTQGTTAKVIFNGGASASSDSITALREGA